MIYNYDYYKHLIIVNKHVTLQRFLEKSGAKTGFAVTMFTNLYGSIFAESHNISNDFAKYYQIEYESLYHFLRRKYSIPKDIAKELEEELMSNENYILIDYDSLSYGMNDNDSFLFGERLFDRVAQILMEE